MHSDKDFNTPAYPFFPFRIIANGNNEMKILSPYTNGGLNINRSAASLLELCNGSLSLSEIVSEIAGVDPAGEKRISELASGFINELASDGLIWIRREKMKWFNVPPPQSVFWEITAACNLKCLHCVVSADKKLEGELCTQSCYNLIDEWKQFGVKDITFSGGEPLIREDFFKLARYARDRGLVIQLATNGILVTQAVAKQIKELNMSVQVSLDGSNPEIYGRFRGRKESFGKALEAIRHLVKEDVDLTVGTVLARHNIDDIPAMLKLVQEEKVKTFRLIPFVPCGRGKENKDLELSPGEVKKVTQHLYSMRGSVPFTILPMEFEHLFKPPGNINVDPSTPSECGGAVSYCTVTPEGDVLPCHFFEGVLADNIKEKPFPWIWRQSRFLNYFRSLQVNDMTGYCRSCKWLGECRGSCKATNFSRGKLFSSNLHCWLVAENS